MAKKKVIPRKELETFMERLSKRPELYEQVCRIMDLSDPSVGGKGLDVNLLEGFQPLFHCK